MDIRAVSGYEWDGRFFDYREDAIQAWARSELVKASVQSQTKHEFDVIGWTSELAPTLEKVTEELLKIKPVQDVHVPQINFASKLVSEDAVCLEVMCFFLYRYFNRCDREIDVGDMHNRSGAIAGAVEFTLEEPALVHQIAREINELRAVANLEE